jgi:hypothetical protein
MGFLQATDGRCQELSIQMVAGIWNLLKIQPANGTTGVPESGRVVVRFAQPVQPAAIVTGTVSLLRGTTKVWGTLALSSSFDRQ